MDKSFIGSFNGTFRAEWLNRWLFVDGQKAQTIIEQWRQEYDHHRPHSIWTIAHRRKFILPEPYVVVAVR